MSYSLIGHFVDVKNKKRICCAEIGFMKNLNTQRYSSDFEDISSTSSTKDEDYPEITTYKYSEFYGYYNPELLNDEQIKGNLFLKKNTFKEWAVGYSVDKRFLDSNKELFSKYEIVLSIEDRLISSDNEDFYKNKILLYYVDSKKTSGTWYKAKDFESIESELKKKYEDAKERLNRLKAFKDTRDWFEMSDDARDNLIGEISYAEEDLEDYEWKYESIVKMNNILDFIANDLGFQYTDEDGSTKYSWRYDDGRDIDVYVEVD